MVIRSSSILAAIGYLGALGSAESLAYKDGNLSDISVISKITSPFSLELYSICSGINNVTWDSDIDHSHFDFDKHILNPHTNAKDFCNWADKCVDRFSWDFCWDNIDKYDAQGRLYPEYGYNVTGYHDEDGNLQATTGIFELPDNFACPENQTAYTVLNGDTPIGASPNCDLPPDFNPEERLGQCVGYSAWTQGCTVLEVAGATSYAQDYYRECAPWMLSFAAQYPCILAAGIETYLCLRESWVEPGCGSGQVLFNTSTDSYCQGAVPPSELPPQENDVQQAPNCLATLFTISGYTGDQQYCACPTLDDRSPNKRLGV